jgi:PKD repeat protein
VDQKIKVRVEGTDGTGTSGADSAEVGPVNAAPPSNVTLPQVNGEPRLGRTLSATTGGWSGTPPFDYTYQWRRCTGPDPNADCTDISGATGQSYVPVSDDLDKTIRVVVTASNVGKHANGGGSDTATSGATGVIRDAPIASFTWSPSAPLTQEQVTFSSNSKGPVNGSITKYEWDLDDDGAFDDATGLTAGRSFRSSGAYNVALKVTDNDNDVDVVKKRITIRNRPPVADFSLPSSPRARSALSFSSRSFDPDGPLVSQNWDLDNDGQFDDGQGADATRTFDKAGTYTVRLEVVDDDGASAVAVKQVQVGQPIYQLMSPFPVVRLAGRLTRTGASIRVLSIRARVTVRCRGRTCGRHRRLAQTARSRSVRFRRFERRLRAGTRIEIFVTQPFRIGKYTRFGIRRGHAPARVDRCLKGTVLRPITCPSE